MPGGQGGGEKVVMLCCQEVARQIASDEFKEANGWQRFWVRLHLLMCRHCRCYAVQLHSIGETARNLWGPHTEDPSTLERLEREIIETALVHPEGGRGDPK